MDGGVNWQGQGVDINAVKQTMIDVYGQVWFPLVSSVISVIIPVIETEHISYT